MSENTQLITEESASQHAMLDLFCAEIRAHVQVIHPLVQLDANYSNANNHLCQQHLMGILSGARLLKLADLICLGTALQQACNGLGSTFVINTQHQLAFKNSLDFLLAVATQAENHVLDSWLIEQQTQIQQLCETLDSITLIKEKSPSQAISSSAKNIINTPQSLSACHLGDVDPSMLNLFQTELETHANALNQVLLELEKQPTNHAILENLMRSAHSIKGAARVLGLDLIVQAAHYLEDCFVAAQHGKLQYQPAHIDVFLRCADNFNAFSQLLETTYDETDIAQLMRHTQDINLHLDSILQDETLLKTNIIPVEIPVIKNTASQKEITPPATKNNRTLRVTANKIDRLMGFAGEVVVSAGWFPSFSKQLLTLKRSQMEISTQLEKLQDILCSAHVDASFTQQVIDIRERNKECTQYLVKQLMQLDVFTSTFSSHSDRLYREMIGVRMRPFADSARGFPRLVRDIARQLGKKVDFTIMGQATEADQDIQEKLDAPLNHLLRNALDHGLETPAERLQAGKPEIGQLTLDVSHHAGMLRISLQDDGRGIDSEVLKQNILKRQLANAEIVAQLNQSELLDFLFLPGFSTTSDVTELSGRGVGLNIVHNMVHEVGGIVRIESTVGKGTSFHLELPLTLSVMRTFLVEIAQEPYAFPLARLEGCLALASHQIKIIENKQYFRFKEKNVALVNIHDVLELDSKPIRNDDDLLNVVIISDRFSTYGLVVDKFMGERDLVIKPLDERLGKIPDISAVAMMLNGTPVLIFDTEDLIHSIYQRLEERMLNHLHDNNVKKASRKRILVADDSITVRETERRLLQSRGYAVDMVSDGMEAWNAVRSEYYDLLISDIDMPRMNGLELIKNIKNNPQLKQLPIIIVSYKDHETHRLQGLAAGADYYLTKSSFDNDNFFIAVEALIGTALDVSNDSETDNA